MPNCFTLTRKGETEPTSLETIDCVVCQRFPDDFTYQSDTYAAWFEVIGFMLAMGVTFDTMLTTRFSIGSRMHRVAAFLNEHYVANAWAQRH